MINGIFRDAYNELIKYSIYNKEIKLEKVLSIFYDIDDEIDDVIDQKFKGLIQHTTSELFCRHLDISMDILVEFKKIKKEYFE